MACKGAKVDSPLYIENLKKVKEWLDQTLGDRPYVFQQDGAPSHTSEETQAWMDKNYREYWSWDMWPAYSPGKLSQMLGNVVSILKTLFVKFIKLAEQIFDL